MTRSPKPTTPEEAAAIVVARAVLLVDNLHAIAADNAAIPGLIVACAQYAKANDDGYGGQDACCMYREPDPDGHPLPPIWKQELKRTAAELGEFEEWCPACIVTVDRIRARHARKMLKGGFSRALEQAVDSYKRLAAETTTP